jgi:Tol biopolymer transport system component
MNTHSEKRGGNMLTSKRIRNLATAVLATFLVLLCALSTWATAQNGRIAFASDRTGSWQIYTMNPDGSDPVQVTNLAPTSDDLLAPSISPNGQKIAFNYDTGSGPDIYVVNADGNGLLQITNDHGSIVPRWSPDGQRIIFTTNSRFNTGVIVTIAADGSGKRKILTTDLWDSIGGVYTPDGKQIVFGSEMGGLISAVWIMKADGSNQRRLTPAALRAQPWGVSPDGKRILAYSNQDSPPALPSDLLVMNLDGSGRKRLAPLSPFHHDLYPSYSPDGTKITFVSDRFSPDITEFTYGTFDVLTVHADGSGVTDVVPTAGSCPFDGNCVTPFWGPNP